MKRIVVVGASLAGLRAAEAVRGAGFEGDLVVLGDEPHRPYNRPPLSKDFLAGERGAEECDLKSPIDVQADWRIGVAATHLDLEDRLITTSQGGEIGFDGLVIATGARARAWSGPVPRGVHTLRSLDDAIAIRRALLDRPRVVVIGAGFIGSEVSSTCRGLGLEVHLVDVAPLPLARVLGHPVAQACASLHLEHGTELHLGVGVAAFEGDPHIERVRLTDGTVIEAGLAIIGLGAWPNSEWLATSGLLTGGRLICDETGRIVGGPPSVVAAGDVAEWPHRLSGGTARRVEHWSVASLQGGIAGKSLLTKPGDRAGIVDTILPSFWSDQYRIRIKSFGDTTDADEIRIVEGDPADRRFVALYLKGGTVSGALGFNDSAGLMRVRSLVGSDVAAIA